MVTRFERADQTQQDDPGIKASNFGGLNTTATPLTIPYEDSPDLVNVDIDLSGAVSKRKGTLIVADALTKDTFTSYFKSSLGYDYVLEKSGTSLFVTEFTNDTRFILSNLPGVFTTAASSEKPFTVTIPGAEARVVYLHKTMAPVHLRFVEQSQLVNTTNGSGTVTVPNCQRYTTVQPIVYVNRQRQVSATTSVNGSGVMTINGLGVQDGTPVRIDLVSAIWAWWAESFRWFGDRFYDSVTRFNVNKVDQNVAVPPKLRSDMDVINKVYGAFPISLFTTNDPTNAFAFSPTGQPNNPVTYGWGDGSVYVSSPANFLNTSPFFATFGDPRTPLPQPPEAVYMVRLRDTPFAGGVGVTGAETLVTVDGVNTPINFGATAGVRQVRGHLTNGAVSSLATDVIRYISFQASNPIGVGVTSVVTMTSTRRTFAGVNASTSDNQYAQGSLFRVYGLGSFCDYGVGSFPSFGAVFQGRLALSGIPSDPSRVIFSGVTDTYDPGNLYTFYQVTDDLDGLDTDPFDLVISSSNTQDIVTGAVEWRSSLFVFTTTNVYQVTGGNDPLTPTRRFVNLISNNGLVNQHSLVKTDETVYYISVRGVYALTPEDGSANYDTLERSLKIRGLTKDMDTPKAWITYDDLTRRLFVGFGRSIPDDLSDTILVYQTQRDAWTVYDTNGKFLTSGGHTYVDTVVGQKVLAIVNHFNVTKFLKFDHSRQADFCWRRFTPLTGGTTVTSTLLQVAVTSHLTLRDRTRYPLNGIMHSGFDNTDDVDVIQGVTKLKFGIDYVMEDRNVVLLKPPTGAFGLEFRPKCDLVAADGVSPYQGLDLMVWVNNVQRFNVSLNTGTNTATIDPFLAGDLIETGHAYIARYRSPLFLLSELKKVKKTKHALVYFDNQPYSSVYLPSDRLNTEPFDNFVDQFKVRASARITMTYDSDRDGVTSSDVYGFRDILWDDALFDIPRNAQRDSYSLFKEPLMGVGYNSQFTVSSYDDGGWSLVGYQIDVRLSGSRYTNTRI